ncbi:MAG: hypothetical protein AVDCRST_MAG13-2384, partial [uncultured Solirubrobacteraceae bacterium]
APSTSPRSTWRRGRETPPPRAARTSCSSRARAWDGRCRRAR